MNKTLIVILAIMLGNNYVSGSVLQPWQEFDLTNKVEHFFWMQADSSVEGYPALVQTEDRAWMLRQGVVSTCAKDPFNSMCHLFGFNVRVWRLTDEGYLSLQTTIAANDTTPYYDVEVTYNQGIKNYSLLVRANYDSPELTESMRQNAERAERNLYSHELKDHPGTFTTDRLQRGLTALQEITMLASAKNPQVVATYSKLRAYFTKVNRKTAEKSASYLAIIREISGPRPKFQPVAPEPLINPQPPRPTVEPPKLPQLNWNSLPLETRQALQEYMAFKTLSGQPVLYKNLESLVTQMRREQQREHAKYNASFALKALNPGLAFNKQQPLPFASIYKGLQLDNQETIRPFLLPVKGKGFSEPTPAPSPSWPRSLFNTAKGWLTSMLSAIG